VITNNDSKASKWNARHAWSKSKDVSVSSVIKLSENVLPITGIALDLACGRGGNTVHLALAGLTVHCWDISDTAITSVRDVAAINNVSGSVYPEVRDVVKTPPEPKRFDVIVVSRFLNRPLCADIAAALKPGGVLLYQTFTQGLSNTDYLLKRYELLDLFKGLDVVWFHETASNDNGFAESMLVAKSVAA